jgi:hypothetical protein
MLRVQWFEIELEYGSGFWWILASVQVVRHWTNMLTQPYGNFAHQRQEQLRPFEFLRFHLPVILGLSVMDWGGTMESFCNCQWLRQR